jgi:hypothetical protein
MEGTTMDVQVNYLAVLLAAVSSMVVGMIWYAKPVFGNIWMKLAKIDDNKAKKGMPKAMVAAFVCSLLTAYVLAHVTYLSNSYFGNSFLQDAVTTAFWLWLGISAARVITHDAFEQRDMKLTALTIGNQLVTLVVMGAVIGLLGV